MIVSPNALRKQGSFDRSVSPGSSPARTTFPTSAARACSPWPTATTRTSPTPSTPPTLALELFDEMASIHSRRARTGVLEAAGKQHNVGRFIAHAAHHKHSYYLIRHSEQASQGFTEQELELTALVACYHRKSEPRPRHPEFAALPDDQQVVRVLAGPPRRDQPGPHLPTGRGEGRRHDPDRRADVELQVRAGEPVDLEIFTAEQRAGLLAQSLGQADPFHRRRGLTVLDAVTVRTAWR
ncbi:MAG: hypothetical protein R2695_08700 [Acidimicrobiales bacterium]